MSAQSRTYGSGPLFGAPSSDQQMRVSDAERQAVADQLATHFADGRLDQAEFDERVARAMSAKTRADLNGLFADLPEPATRGPQGSQNPQDMPSARPHRHGHPVLLLVLVVVVVLAAAHAVLAGPWLWLGLVVAAVLFVNRGARHNRPRQDRPSQDR
jgi:hypothetical protein